MRFNERMEKTNTVYHVKRNYTIIKLSQLNIIREGIKEFRYPYSKSVYPCGDLIGLGDIVTGLSYFNTLASGQ